MKIPSWSPSLVLIAPSIGGSASSVAVFIVGVGETGKGGVDGWAESTWSSITSVSY